MMTGYHVQQGLPSSAADLVFRDAEGRAESVQERFDMLDVIVKARHERSETISNAADFPVEMKA